MTLRILVVYSLLLLKSLVSEAQTYTRIPPLQADGFPIADVSIWLKDSPDGLPSKLTDSTELVRFYRAFGIRPGTIYNQFLMSAAVKRILEEPQVATAEAELYNTQINGSIWVKLIVETKDITKEEITAEKRPSGMFAKGGQGDFPVLYENSRSKVTFILNGGTGIFNEVNTFFGEGAAFTQGNPIATDPAGQGVRFWGEAFLEPGLAAITKLGNTRAYAYGAASVLISGRNTSDIYSEGATAFADFERLYAGILWAGLGKERDLNINISAGRNFFQLNDAFLISRISGSANAGARGNVYLSSRTAFEKTLLASISKQNWHASFLFLEPAELAKTNQSNINITGGSLDWHKNPHYEIGVTYLTISNGRGFYAIPEGRIEKRGMYIINPKVWLKRIGGTGAYLKSEYAYQSHRTADMKSQGWYIGGGYETSWKWKPNFYYRYAHLSGDDESTVTYERFDPLLTGGLGLWVQGINNRKVIGNGNIISHRVQVQTYFSKKWDVSLDYFFLQSDELLNLGGLAPIKNLESNKLGQEVTLSTRYFLSSHFMLLGIFSHAIRGEAIRKAFSNPTYDWTSFQLAIFMFY